MIKFALEYLNKWNFSIIPLLPNKKPFASLLPKDEEGKPTWKPFQTTRATEKEIRRWWAEEPKALIGIVTGEISSIAVIDIDTREIPDELLGWWQYDIVLPPVVETPRGSHYYFAYKHGITNTVDVGRRKGIDVRGEGGYVVAPPSVTEEGKRYKWAVSLGGGLPRFPIEILSQTDTRLEKPVSPHGENDLPAPKEDTFIEGRRDNDLFHVAHLLVKGGMMTDQVNEVVMRLAQTCSPPFPENEAKSKVDSAVKRAVRKERPLAKEVEEWVLSSTGFFLSSEIARCLQLSSRNEEKNISQILIRLKERGIIEKHGKKHGEYRRVGRELIDIDWRNADLEPLDIKLPLGLDTMVNLYDGDIIVIAGESNAGKSAMCLDITEQNMNAWAVHYFSSELGAAKLRKRISLTDTPQDEWNFFPHDKSSDYHHFLFDGAINIIDFIIVTDNFWEVGGIIKDIHFALRGKKGIAIICIQKDPKKEFGRGGDITRELASLYITLSQTGMAKIIKLKDWKGHKNPNRQIVDFKLHKAYKFESIGYWHDETI